MTSTRPLSRRTFNEQIATAMPALAADMDQLRDAALADQRTSENAREQHYHGGRAAAYGAAAKLVREVCARVEVTGAGSREKREDA